MNKEHVAIIIMATLIITTIPTTTIAAAQATVDLIQDVEASSLSLEAPPLPSLFLNGTETNLTADDKDRDISVDPVENITFANGTVSISTAGATDMDINDFPPVGITVLVQNDSVTITKNQVQIIDPLPSLSEEIARQAIESNDDGGGSDEDEDE